MISLNDILKNSLGQGVLSSKPQQLEQKSDKTSSVTLSSEQKSPNLKIKLPRIAFDPQPNIKFIKYTHNEFLRLPESLRKCMNVLLEKDSVCKFVYPKQETIAKELGMSVRHTRRLLKELEKLGLIHIEHRPKTSNLYRISSFFKKPEVKRELSSVFVAFRRFIYFSTSLLVASAQAGLQEHVRQDIILKKNIYINNNNTLIVSNVAQKRSQKVNEVLVKPEKEDLYKKYERPKTKKTYNQYNQQQSKPLRIPSRQTYVAETIVIDTAVQKAQVLCNAIRDFKPSFIFSTVKEAVRFIVKGEYRLTGEKDEDIAIAFLEKKKKEYDN